MLAPDETAADDSPRHRRIVGVTAGPACPGRVVAPGTLPRVQARRPPHPSNDLNELSGEEWLYFTKSVWTTAYPSELGHARRKAHGANKPPRLMARLIEFFTKSGELVLDPFAGVGGTLLGAAIARGPRRALGIELDERWTTVFAETVAALRAERDGAGPLVADLGRPTRAASGASTRRAWSCGGATHDCSSRRCRATRSISSPRTRRTTSSWR